jgi:HK97 family phage major capsid protein
MNVQHYERVLAEAQQSARAVIDRLTNAADKEGRDLTDGERRSINGALQEVNDLRARLENARKGQDSMQAFNHAVERAGARGPARSGNAGGAVNGASSIGAQIVGSEVFQSIIERARTHTLPRHISTPMVELHPFAETLTETGGSPGSGGDLVVADYRPGILPTYSQPPTIADLLASGTTDSNAVTYMREELFTNAADTVAEGEEKPESTLRFEQATDTVVVIAHWLPVTMQILEDVAGLRSYIDSRLQLGVLRAEDDKLLNGANTPGELTGFLNRTGLAASVAGGAGAQANAEAILQQINAIRTATGMTPDGVVINPTNWQTLQLMKDLQNQYMGSGPFQSPTRPTIWGVPVVVTSAIAAGTALVGAFKTGAQLFRHGPLRVDISNSHADYFIRNMLAIRAEERVALAVYRPSAFGLVTGLD